MTAVHSEPEAAIDHESLAATALTIARRCSAGATMWCLAPASPEHGRHVAVEFVHPVIMGARALPAVEVPAVDPVASLRLLAQPGDVVVAVGRADDRTIGEVMRRSEAWGLTTVWIGAGPRPPSGSARHVVWVDDPAGTAEHDGSLVLQYHLLWEMTHICFDHPGALAEPADECTDDVCITCSDEGVVAEVEVLTPDGLVIVRTGRGREMIDATLVGSVVAGDLLLVHAGSAITRLEVP